MPPVLAFFFAGFAPAFAFAFAWAAAGDFFFAKISAHCTEDDCQD
jgi:hypothetical protein